MTTTVKLNADQDEIREVARNFLTSRFPSDRIRSLMTSEDGFEQSSWEEISELGWTAIALPEEQGGAGYSLVERCLLLEEMGRVLFPDPYLSSAVMVADALAIVAGGEAGEEILAKVGAGSVRAALVAAGDLLGDLDLGGEVRAAAVGDGYELSGNGGLTLDGASAELLVVVAAIGGAELGLFAVEPGVAGLERTPAPTIDETRKTAVVEFAATPAVRLDAGDGTEAKLAQVIDRAAISLAAEQIGGAQQALDMTISYMKEREQFGGPIGRFQALKHRLADLHVLIDGAREGVYSAADAIESGDFDQVPMAVAAAKLAASDAYVLATAEAVQLHGGIGFTEEHDIGLYYKRALVSAPMLGSSPTHLERIIVGLNV
jgi:alkylation response protein AidB-like acyl-CoA dehydrogenase